MTPRKIQNTKWITVSSLIAALAASGPALFANDTNQQNQQRQQVQQTQSQRTQAQAETQDSEKAWYNPTGWFENDSNAQAGSATASDNRDDGINWRFWEDDDAWSEEYDQPSRSATGADQQASSNYTWNAQSGEWERDNQNQGQQQDGDTYTSSSYSSVDRSNQDSNAREATLSGEIEAFRRMNLQAQDDQQREYVVSRIKLDNGENIVVSLGERENLDRLNLEKGSQVELSGVPGRVGGEPIFIATELQTNNESVDVNRAIANLEMDQLRNSSQSQSQSQQASADRMQSGNQQDQSAQMNRQSESTRQSDRLSSEGSQDGYAATRDRSASASQQTVSAQIEVNGQVERIESANIEGADDSTQLASIQLQNGQSVTLELGSDTSPEDLQLESGDEIRIVGSTREIGEQHVVRAEQVWVNGDEAQQFSYSY